MPERTMTASFGLRLAATGVQVALANLFWFLAPMLAVSFLAAKIRDGAQWLGLNASPVAALVFVISCAGAWLGLLLWFAAGRIRDVSGKIRISFAAGVIAGAATLWVYIFGVLSWTLLKLGLVSYVFTGAPGEELSNLVDSYLWHLLDLIPALNINQALGWQPDVALNGGWRGVVLLLFRVLIIYQVFALARKLFVKRDAPVIRAAEKPECPL